MPSNIKSGQNALCLEAALEAASHVPRADDSVRVPESKEGKGSTSAKDKGEQV